VRQVGSDFSITVGASLWHFDEPEGQGLSGFSVSELLSAAYSVTEEVSTRLDVQHAYSADVGHRLRGLVNLAIEVWR